MHYGRLCTIDNSFHKFLGYFSRDQTEHYDGTPLSLLSVILILSTTWTMDNFRNLHFPRKLLNQSNLKIDSWTTPNIEGHSQTAWLPILQPPV